MFSSSRDNNSVLTIYIFFHFLKAIASYILSGFTVVFGGRASLLVTLSKMKVEALYLTLIF